MIQSRAMETPQLQMTRNVGPLGRPRGIGFGILLFIVTFGFYSWYWVYKTQEEMKQHTGDGLGGVLGLVVWILVSFVSAFVIPSEIGAMYRKDGQEPRSEEHTSELQSLRHLVCRLLLEKKK